MRFNPQPTMASSNETQRSKNPASLITGAASGIGRSISLALAALGHDLTLLDLDSRGLDETVRLARAAVPESHRGSLATVCLDIADEAAQAQAFAHHVERHRRLDVVVLGAGVGERGPLFQESANGWQTTLGVDLTAVIVGIRCSVLSMRKTGSRGTVISISSAGGLFPMPASPVYAAAKSGLVQFTRSAAHSLFRTDGIRLMSVCPEFVDTPMVRTLMSGDPQLAVRVFGSLDLPLLQPQQVTQVALELIHNQEHPPGSVVLLQQDGAALRVFPQPRTDLPFAGKAPLFDYRHRTVLDAPPGPTTRRTPADDMRVRRAAWTAGAVLPARYRKIQVSRLSTRFAEATRVVEEATPGGPGGPPVPPGHLLVRRAYVGINASDINYSAGRYFGSSKEAEARLPFDAGFESVNVVVSVGPDVTGYHPGDAVAALAYGSFSEYGLVPAAQALPVPCASPAVVALLTSGLTASIALEVAGRVNRGDVVLVTAAAGGTGQFAVQLAKQAGCTVIATCSSEAKADLLRRLGVDRVVNYKTERLQEVLKAEFPRGVDVVYESVGGAMFTTALNALAPRGRLIVIGMISQYEEGWHPAPHVGLPEKLLWKSASVTGFFLLRHAALYRAHLQRLLALYQSGRLHVEIDREVFVGLESVAGAVQRLYSGASSGKVVVQVAPEPPPDGGQAPACPANSKL